MKRIALITLGCKVNQADSDELSECLASLGIQISPYGENVNAVILRTCAVTASAVADVRSWIRRIRREYSSALLVVVGCRVELNQKERMECDIAWGIADAKGLAEHLASALEISSNRATEIINTNLTRTRPLVKIQDGCDDSCAYCIVPSIRGPSRSIAKEQVISKIQQINLKGYKEVVLTGVHIGAYGRDLIPSSDFSLILQEIVDKTDVHRLRLSSVEPLEVTSKLIELFGAYDALCPHLHIPLQSGDSNILKTMNRRYTPEQYLEVVESLAKARNGFTIGADIIVGFPGETTSAFENTMKLIERSPLSHLHVFPFSPRPGTLAEGMSGKVNEREIRRRAKVIRELGLKKRTVHYQSFIGKTLKVLIEKSKNGISQGTSREYIPIKICEESNVGEEIEVMAKCVDTLSNKPFIEAARMK